MVRDSARKRQRGFPREPQDVLESLRAVYQIENTIASLEGMKQVRVGAISHFRQLLDSDEQHPNLAREQIMNEIGALEHLNLKADEWIRAVRGLRPLWSDVEGSSKPQAQEPSGTRKRTR